MVWEGQGAVDAATSLRNKQRNIQEQLDMIPPWVFILGNPQSSKQTLKAAQRIAREDLGLK